MKGVVIFITLFVAFSMKAQIADTIIVDFTKSAYLVFDSEDVKFDCGSEDVIVRISGNKLILQAGVEDFEPTNLFVESSGKMFVFIVAYGDPKGKFLYNYANLKSSINKTTQDTITNTSKEYLIVNTASKDSVDASYASACEKLMVSPDRILNRGVIKYKISIYLRDMVIVDNKIYMEFEMINKGNIPYVFDYYKYNVTSVKRKIKGEGVQTIELVPVLEYKRPTRLEGMSTCRYVIVMDKFALTENKKLVIEHWEDNGKDMDIEGGRKINFDLFSKDVLNVGKL